MIARLAGLASSRPTGASATTRARREGFIVTTVWTADWFQNHRGRRPRAPRRPSPSGFVVRSVTYVDAVRPGGGPPDRRPGPPRTDRRRDRPLRPSDHRHPR